MISAIFFLESFDSGNQYWVTNGDRFFSPQPLSNLGLPDYVDKLDDAFIWGKNDKTYFFYQNLYWRYNEATKTMDSGYPQDISRWGGVRIEWTGKKINIYLCRTMAFF